MYILSQDEEAEHDYSVFPPSIHALSFRTRMVILFITKYLSCYSTPSKEQDREKWQDSSRSSRSLLVVA
jgi:hypothetical protein